MEFKNLAVLGSGVMGHGIAQVAAMAGYGVALRDIRQDLLDKAIGKIRWSLEKTASKGRITPAHAEASLARIRPVVDLADAVSGADLVIEAVPEDMALKRRVYAELDSAAGPGAVFASNTSTLPITEIASVTSRPERFIGIHFFNPPQLMKLVEVIPGERTGQDVTDAVSAFVSSAGKEAVICRRDVPGFIVNRLFIPLVHEACHLMDRTGATREEVDSAVRFRMGFPMGILELADFTGLDVIHKATSEMHARDRGVVRPHPSVAELHEKGRLGQKSGGGFYDYGEGNYERVALSEELAGRVDPAHLVANIANNAAWLITNGASDEEEVERAARLGLGLRIPVFESARKAGLPVLVSELKKLESEFGPTYAPDPYLSKES
ncbi:MAG: 3-hydroxyacyl-CoA dehydrogenase [Nitrosopumilus sp.]|nr:3-hydroxyacyl-CoA dehydrogenase [Nitrosopumilus sp.]CAI9831507.1 3-hydroxybutyryl-CoA dehydrogenase [Nitrosopumilaceae archaeon]MDA7944590.1 3-hydroxyacyl-CoA dehydrogenase [Nitrosopumilus sp.]MDA7952247.1 3-hydroxyacyl-CoA dehydrogenase [Nitrosopumilus sp.]MDA7953905.1 3-hydroxyacyl-CoA dehydrogenase [Nitrosopumilus sp.]